MVVSYKLLLHLDSITNIPSDPASSPESPIYGLNGPVRPSLPIPSIPRAPNQSRLNQAPAVASSQSLANTPLQTQTENSAINKDNATAKLLKVIEEISGESLQLPDPNPNTSKSMQFSDASSPRSGGSPFSLGRFPLPPALPAGKLENDEKAGRGQRNSGAGSDVDAEFDLVPPQRFETRLQSFPSTTRGSDIGISISPDTGLDALSVDQYHYSGREITSFIGGGASGANRELSYEL